MSIYFIYILSLLQITTMVHRYKIIFVYQGWKNFCNMLVLIWGLWLAQHGALSNIFTKMRELALH